MYVQYTGMPAPSELYPGTWENVTSTAGAALSGHTHTIPVYYNISYTTEESGSDWTYTSWAVPVLAHPISSTNPPKNSYGYPTYTSSSTLTTSQGSGASSLVVWKRVA